MTNNDELNCFMCFENYKNSNISYLCKNTCFINSKTDIIICNKCLIEWCKLNNELTSSSIKYKCPGCKEWSFNILDIEGDNIYFDIEDDYSEDDYLDDNISQINNYNENKCNVKCCKIRVNSICERFNKIKITLKTYLFKCFNKCSFFLYLILYLLILILIGFIISSLWLFIIVYDCNKQNFYNEVIIKEWKEPYHYLGICPIYACFFIILVLLCIKCFKE